MRRPPLPGVAAWRTYSSPIGSGRPAHPSKRSAAPIKHPASPSKSSAGDSAQSAAPSERSARDSERSARDSERSARHLFGIRWQQIRIMSRKPAGRFRLPSQCKSPPRYPARRAFLLSSNRYFSGGRAASRVFRPASASEPRCTRRVRRPLSRRACRSPRAWAFLKVPKV